MKIEQYSSVMLKDGRRAAIVEVWDDTHFEADVGSSSADWETITVSVDEIERVITDG